MISPACSEAQLGTVGNVPGTARPWILGRHAGSAEELHITETGRAVPRRVFNFSIMPTSQIHRKLSPERSANYERWRSAHYQFALKLTF
jgi:hypothetical protein